MFDDFVNPRRQVSVVIPAYEAAMFIEATLATVVAQTMLPLEVIVVDDGSKDDTCGVVERFSHEHPELGLRLLREPHHGPGATRNAGIRAAAGSWIAFLDSDDLWAPQKLERMVELAVKSPGSNFICHNELHRRLDGNIVSIDYFDGYQLWQSLSKQLYVRNRISTSTVLCQKQLIVDCGGFDTTLANAQDYELWLRMSPNLTVLFIAEELGTYVERQGNITSGNAWRRMLNVLRVLHRHRGKVDVKTSLRVMMLCVAAYSYRAML